MQYIGASSESLANEGNLLDKSRRNRNRDFYDISLIYVYIWFILLIYSYF